MCLAVPGRIVSVDDSAPLMRVGKVDFGGVAREVNLACIPEAAVGDYVLVHVGFAISIVDADEAQRVFDYLREIEALEANDDMAGTA
jgi:hydrogenase expression/formation protein HypC